MWMDYAVFFMRRIIVSDNLDSAMKTQQVNRVKAAVLAGIVSSEVLIACSLLSRHSLTYHVALTLVAILLTAPLLLWNTYLRQRQIFGLAFITDLCAFVTFGDVLSHRVAPALGFGSVFAFGMFRILYRLYRHTKSP